MCKAADYALQKGIIIADTKFEFGRTAQGITLADEVLTPDSSRFWPADKYAPGRAQESFDKQYVRDYLEEIRWNKQPPAPALPAEVARGPARNTSRRTTSSQDSSWMCNGIAGRRWCRMNGADWVIIAGGRGFHHAGGSYSGFFQEAFHIWRAWWPDTWWRRGSISDWAGWLENVSEVAVAG